MTVEEAIKKLDELELRDFALGYASGTLSYEGDTIAPRDSRIPRGRAQSVLSGELHRLVTGKDVLALMDFLREHRDELSPRDQRRLKLWEKTQKELLRIPVEEYTAFAELLNDSNAVWYEAKEKSDFSMFAPYLEKVIAKTKRFASLVEPDMDPYDYCLDKYEEGLTKERCDAFFTSLREELVPLVKRVGEAGEPDTTCLSVRFPIPAQRELAGKLMDIMGIDRNRCILGETEHPFTSDFSKYDVRITTHYHENNFLSSMFSVVHEGGHALYELHTADDLQFTSLAEGVSMGVHESQSRFFENIIGRSREFIELITPELKRLCPELDRFTAEDLYRAANKAGPSLIRTEADELTYCLHIMVRYELEKAFIDGDVPVSELPERWNALYREYLGIEVPSDREGILQDSHWSNGQIGYFPSYALGSAYGAQLLSKMQETVDVRGCVANGDMGPIRAWLEERIWRYGRLKPPKELIEGAFGGPFDPGFYTAYLTRRMADVYGV